MSGEKRTVLDVLAQDETGRKVNVEIQTVRKPAYFERSLFNWARLYGRQLPAGENYSKLRPVVMLNFLEYNFLEGDEAVHDFRLAFSDHLVIVHVELLKLLCRENAGLNIAELWGKFLESPTAPWGETAPSLAPALQAAQKRLEDFMALTPDVVREIFEEKWELDQLTMKAELQRIAREEGLAEGKAEGFLLSARRMHEAGFSPEQILAVTGLSVEALTKD